MQTGPSRELFELWAPDSRNGLIITGYSIEGTLARVSDFHENPIPCHLRLYVHVHETMDFFFMNCASIWCQLSALLLQRGLQ